jgi:hypothetical protein
MAQGNGIYFESIEKLESLQEFNRKGERKPACAVN